MKRILPLFIFLFSLQAAYSQCLNIDAVASGVSCFNGNDGQITINVISGVGPFTYELYLFRPGFGSTPMGSVNTASTSVVFQKGNGTLSPLFEATGIRANNSINPPGNEYRVFVSASGTSGDPFCETLGENGLIVTQPTQLNITLNDIDPDCDPAVGTGNGKIDITVSGGVGPYIITWAGPTAIADGTEVTASTLDAGSYTVEVTDDNGCVHSLNIDLPVATQADAGPATGTTCGANSFALSGNTPGPGEIGTWTGPPGVTFSPNATTPNATANNLGPGSNVLRWTIVDSGGLCPGTFDEITVTFSPAISLSTTVTDVLCHGASTGAIDLNIAGGVSPFTYAWSNGALSQDLTNIPAGTYSVTVTDAVSCVSVLSNITVAEPAAAVDGDITKVDVLCFGDATGSITITGIGGVAPYDFSIDGGATYTVLNAPSTTYPGLVAGSYNLIVRDANGCQSASIPVTINQPANAVSGTTTQVDVLCFGDNTGSIAVTGTGGVAPYDFSIDGGTTYPALDAASHTFVNLTATAYNLVVRDANGCESAVIPVTIDQPAAATNGNMSVVDVLCFGDDTGSITVTGTGGTSPYDFSIDAGATYPVNDAASNVFSGLTAGTYNLIIRDANGCESAVIPVTINSPAAAVGGNTSLTHVLCLGDDSGAITVTGTGGLAPYDFSIDGGATYPVLAAASNAFTDLTAGNYSLTVRDANGCVSPPISATLTEPGTAVNGTTTQVDVLCFGDDTGSITITGTGGVSPYDFSIDGGLTYPVLDGGSNVFTDLSAGAYSLTVRDANGCVSAPISVTINEPVAAVSGTTTQVNILCFGDDTGSITITGTGGVSPYDFSVDGGATYPSLDAATHSFTDLTSGTYNLVVRDANGCVSPAIPVTLTQPATAVSGNTTQVDVLCFGDDTGSINITGTGGIAPYDFSIDGGATFPAADVASHTFTDLLAGTYNLKVRDANGCESALIPLVITQPAAGTSANTSKTDVTCFGGSDGSITINGAGGTGPYDFSIDGGATYPVSDVAAHTFLTLSPGNFNLRVRDFNGCESALILLTISEPAEVTASTSAVGAITICEGSALPDVIFTFTGVPPFDFSYTNGAPFNVADHPSNTFTINAASEGTYAVTALTDNNGCVATNLGGSITVTEEPAATAEAGNPQTICATEVVALAGSSVGGAANTGAWSIVSMPGTGDGTLSDETQTGAPDVVTFTATVPGIYTLRLTTNNPAGACEAVSDDVQITVTAGATVDAGPPITICESETVTLAGSSSGTTGITWSTSGDGSFNNASLPNAVYTPGNNDKAIGTVTLTIQTAGPCASIQDDVIVTINDNPTVDAGVPQTICSSGFVVLDAGFGGSATGLLWTTSGNGAFDDPTDPNARYTPGSTDINDGAVTLTATATGTCAGFFDEVIITVNPEATVNAGVDQNVCIGSTVALDATIGGSAASMTWSTSGNGTFSNPADPDAVYTPSANDIATGTVTLTATTNNPPGQCPAVNDNLVLTFVAIPGDETTPGNESWIGYVYDDSGDPTPIPAKIDFNTAKYRGYVESADIDNMTSASVYTNSSDEFDLNLAIAEGIHGPNVCGTYTNQFSVRYKMNKTFAAGVYRFTVGGDDGVRLIIDGADYLPAAAFDFQSYTTYTTDPVCLSAGSHSFEIHYFDNTAQSRLTFQYEEVPAPVTNSPVQVCVNSPIPTLTASSTDPQAVGFNWYKDGTLVFSGPNYTPSVAELDMSTAAATAFQVTAVYGCGESAPEDVQVEVLNSATLTIHDQTICETGGIVDLRTFIDEVPPGGTFVFSGHPNIAGNNFDPSGLAGNTISILVDYSNGSCTAPQGTLDVTITNTASVTVPSTTPVVCEGSADVDLTTLVQALPAGGVFTFSGPQVTGNNFDPSGLIGPQTMTVDYSVGGCVASQTTFDIDVTTSASLVLNNITACENGSTVNLLSLVTATPAGGLITFSGPGVSGNLFDPSGLSGVVNIGVDYDFNGCTDNGSLQVTILAPTDPLCMGGNCASVVIIPKPEPATCTNSDGRMVMSIKPFTPAVNNTGVKITIDGISSTGLAITRTVFNDSVFNLLPVGSYNYSIEYGDPSCIKTGIFSIDQSGTVGTPVVSNLVAPQCFGSATGSLTLDVPGETGNILEWSLDAGITDPFKPFTAGTQISGLSAGPAPTFQQVISVRRNITDVCYSSVTVTIPESVTPVVANFSVTPATCNGNDGSITNIVASGGNDAPFTYSIDGGQSFQPTPTFNGLAGGAYALRVRDALGCVTDFPVNVTFPGFINTAISKTNANCTNGGESGTIAVTVSDLGAFQVALTTDQFNAPSDDEYLPYSNPSVIFDELPRGQYYVYVKSTSSACPTRSAPIDIFGVYDITFGLETDCNNNELSLALVNVTGESGGAPLEIQVSKKLSADPPEIIYVQFPADGEIYLSHDDYAFLRTPGDYRIKVIQFQFEVVCNLSSETVDFTVPSTLSASIGPVNKSYPDIPTGELSVVGFTGGAYPFDVRIELDSASSFSLPYHSTDFEEVRINGNQQIEMSYDHIPAGRYQVEVRDSLGCIVDLTARVPLDEDLFIPNLFTPNGDGSNDVFFIRNLPQEPAINQLVISNRWGKEVFVSENYQNNWDGTGAADGIYFYRLQVSGNDPLTGWVEIIRGPKP